jgi:ParB family chromosome partitioning protein
VANRQQKRLGKGLSALLGEYVADEVPREGDDVARIPVSALRPNPFQPRRELTREKLDDLIGSIEENGLLHPIVVRPAGDGEWEIVAGERRWRAVSELGWARVPAVIRDLDDRTMLVLALVENLQREELDPLEEARAYRRLIDEFDLTQGDVAETVGRDRSTVANTIRLLGLPGPVQELVAAGRLSAGHARALLTLEDEEAAIRLGREAAEEGLSVREVERRVRDGRPSRRRQRPTKPSVEPDPYVRRAEQRLGRALGTDVRIRLEGEAKGKIEVPFADAEDFERILEAIAGRDSEGL